MQIKEMQAGIRRNIQTLKPQERKRYFWCIKMLGILPPFQANKERTFRTLGYQGDKTSSNPDPAQNLIEPKCLHDEMIANHATCCEHQSFFFGYYHRHLMVYFEMLINYVDEVLNEEYAFFSEKFPNLYQVDSVRWDKVIKIYKQLSAHDRKPGQKRHKVMAHYWNPTNYNNRDDLVIPIELSDPTVYPHELDDVDQLFNKVRKHYPYQINPQTRWYNKPEVKHQKHENCQDNECGKTCCKGRRYKFQQKMLAKQYAYFYQGKKQQQKYYTKEEKQILQGKTNARSSKFSDFYPHYEKLVRITSDQISKSMKMTSAKNYRYYKQNGKMILYCQDEKEALVNYGGRFDQKGNQLNLHYLNSEQVGTGFQRINKVNYNSMLPHYQIGYALFNQIYDDFVNFLIPWTGRANEKSHATMHNNLHFSMIDGLFSLTNLMFFPYHSWIDIQIEMKLRSCNTPTQAAYMHRYLIRKTNRREYLDPILNPNAEQRIYGDYPITEWCDPKFTTKVLSNDGIDFQDQVKLCKQLQLTAQKSIRYAFKASQYILIDSCRLRTTLELDQVYKSSYIPKNSERFKEYEGFKYFNASYDYQIFQTKFLGMKGGKPQLQHITRPLGQYPEVYIPEYLTAMKQQVNEYSSFIKGYIKRYRSDQKEDTRSDKYYFDLVSKALMLHVKYKSSTPSGTYIVQVNTIALIRKLSEKGYKLTLEQVFYLITLDTSNKGLVAVLILIIFGKGTRSKQCCNCGDFKNMVFNMSEELFTRNPKLWSYINSTINKQVLYDSSSSKKNSEDDETGDLDIHQLLVVEYVKHPTQYFTFMYIQGSEKVLLEIQVESENNNIDTFNMEIILDVNSVQQHRSICAANKELTSEDLRRVKGKKNLFVKDLEFYNLRDNGERKRNDLDGLIYNRVTFHIFAYGKTLDFNFPIKGYHEIVRYKILIKINDQTGEIGAIAEDADYAFKKGLYTEPILPPKQIEQ